MLQIVSVDGMPLSALVAFDAKGPNETEVRPGKLVFFFPREGGRYPTTGGGWTSDGVFDDDRGCAGGAGELPIRIRHAA